MFEAYLEREAEVALLEERGEAEAALESEVA